MVPARIPVEPALARAVGGARLEPQAAEGTGEADPQGAVGVVYGDPVAAELGRRVILLRVEAESSKLRSDV